MKSAIEIVSEHIAIAQTVLNDHKLMEEINAISRLVVDTFTAGNKILLCGNGGSAADAQHIAAEWQGRFLLDRKPLPAEALHVNSSYLTAVANDYGYHEVYSRAVEANGKKNDLLFALTTSGKSDNIMKAMQRAKQIEMKVIGLTGNNPPTTFIDLCDLLIQVPSSTTARIQEMHILIGHIICEQSEHLLFAK